MRGRLDNQGGTAVRAESSLAEQVGARITARSHGWRGPFGDISLYRVVLVFGDHGFVGVAAPCNFVVVRDQLAVLSKAAVCFSGIDWVTEKTQDRVACPRFAFVGANALVVQVPSYVHGSGLVECHLPNLEAVDPLLGMWSEFGALPNSNQNFVLLIAERSTSNVEALPGDAVLHIAGPAGNIDREARVPQCLEGPVESRVRVLCVNAVLARPELDVVV